ncbi:MAG: carbohydrate kinase, partial [Clostridia bacterium]|nr:carbohydrate kinase [Clostridia bacterium]
MKYLMGIDNGGTFVKAAVFDENGNQISVASCPVPITAPAPGYAERDMNELWSANVTAIKQALEKSGVDSSHIAGVSFSGHGKGLYLVDNDGKPAYNGILSQDTRAWEYIQKWKNDGTKEKVYQKSFQEILVGQPVSLMAWLRDHHPEVLEKTRYLFSVKDYIRFKLTGEAYGEYTDFSGGNLLNLTTKTYDKELLGYFGLERYFGLLPPLSNSGEICGAVSPEAARLTGLQAGTPAAAGMFDVDACGLASGLVDEDGMCMIAGTWSINEYVAKEPLINGTVALNSLYCIPGYYLVEESSPTSAGNLEWLLRQLMPRQSGRLAYSEVNALVESIEPGESQVLFLPFLNGSNEDALAKAAWVGLTAFHEKKHMIRAVY